LQQSIALTGAGALQVGIGWSLAPGGAVGSGWPLGLEGLWGLGCPGENTSVFTT